MDFQNNNTITYTVKSGDSLYSIANQFHTTVDSLIYLNKLHNTILSVGQVLIISQDIYQSNDSYSSYQEFIDKNKGNGILRVQVYLAKKAFPLKDVHVTVSKIIGKEKMIFFQGDTNESGIVNEIVLPTVLMNYNNPIETVYSVETSHSRYQQRMPRDASIYDGVKSIVDIEMIPIGEEYES